jgi:hypothetical protein
MEERMAHRTFEEWMKEVDRVLVKRCGLCHQDLPDCCYNDWWEDGYSPAEAAAAAIEEAGTY